ncbi:MAG: hypothetical protein ACXW4B_00155 [Micavibrio sp.]
MGTVVSIDLIRQQKRDGRKNGSALAGGGGGGFDGLYPCEYQGIIDLFDLAQDSGLVLKMTIQPYAGGFLFRAFSAADPYYTLFEIQKVRSGRMFEYHGRVRHQLVAVELNFFPFMGMMRVEILRLIDLFGPDRPRI